jgi:hypothetical protein
MRKIVLGVAAAATLLAAWFAPDQDGGVVGPAAATTREPAAARAGDGAGGAGNGGSAGAGAGAIAGTASTPDGAGPTAATTMAGAAGAANGAPAAQWLDLQIHPRVADDELGNLFAKQSWQPEAPKKVLPPQVAEAPPARAGAAAQPGGAPPLPFQFLGRFVEDGKSAYFLQVDGRNVVARPGEKIDDNYLLEGAAHGALQFIYLPLNERQSLAVGDNN